MADNSEKNLLSVQLGDGTNPAKGAVFCLQLKEIIGITTEQMGNANDDDALAIYNDEGTGSFGKTDDMQGIPETEEVSESEDLTTVVVENGEDYEEIETLSKNNNVDKDWSQ
ncbi:uncharacterized protein LOC117167955 isoform X2 [Belonocnema kinseyi]|uniref:uncharacterized protein LOC117167955 isoform X2 n=1 Tax=Belonocnema kinseyi TaxID=2817044 RepID=UPI00143D080F|nr:uncharacterized protein LOC117167955 isoform X2 [Belonocnema kinseyi]